MYSESSFKPLPEKLGYNSRSVLSNSVTPWTIARQAPLSMGFSKLEYWSGLPFPSPGDLPNPGFKPRSPTLKVDSLLSEPLAKSYYPSNLSQSQHPELSL